MAKNKKSEKLSIRNPNAFRNYDLLEKYEAGIVLFGTEVKSVVKGKCNISDSYCIFRDGEAYILNMHISPYEHGDRDNKEPKRTRKLLLNKREILKLSQKVKEKSLSVVPTYVYMSRNKVKIEIALAKGKKIYDKRKDIQEKDVKRKLDRTMKGWG